MWALLRATVLFHRRALSPSPLMPMEISGFLSGSPPLKSCHNMMSLDNSVSSSHSIWSSKATGLRQLESSHQTVCSKWVSGPNPGSAEQPEWFTAHFNEHQIRITRAINRHWAKILPAENKTLISPRLHMGNSLFSHSIEAVTWVSQILLKWYCCGRSWKQRSLHYK